MDYERDIKLPFRTSGISVDADGAVDIIAQSGYEDITITLELDEIKEMLIQARAHKAAYDAWIANDYEYLLDPKDDITRIYYEITSIN